MSGTSLDGLDLAYARFSRTAGQWAYELLQTASVPYTATWRQTLQQAINRSAAKLADLDLEYGRWLGQQSKSFIERYNLQPDLIASHGHTVFHQPGQGITLQIGAGRELANRTGYPVINNFRQLDVTLGGQGAPLVPIGDELLFGNYAACLNLGGIANISFRKQGQRVAFDIGLANMLLNHLANQAGKLFDAGGCVARTGRVDHDLLRQLNSLPYYHLPYPKSVGYEWFVAEVQPLLGLSKASVADKLATAVEHVAMQTGRVFNNYVTDIGSVLVTGGGALNDFLMERLTAFTPAHLKIVIPDRQLLEFKEALIFAFMGVLRWRNEVNCLCSVTGAGKDCSGGDIFPPAGKSRK